MPAGCPALLALLTAVLSLAASPSALHAQVSATLTILDSFIGSDGNIRPAALVQGGNGNFYGTTYGGGADGHGTVFQITTAGVLTTLYSFSGSGGDGENPYAALVRGSDGNFYGTTYNGGTGGAGTVFQITPAGVLTIIHSFLFSDGDAPGVLFEDNDGNFYGTSSDGGTDSAGTVFKLVVRPAFSPGRRRWVAACTTWHSRAAVSSVTTAS